MHISEGVLSGPALLAGACVTVAGTAVGLRKLDGERLVTVALAAAAFFTASLVHIPLGPASGHLILNGLAGVLLGWAAFPAILAGLVLQAVLFQYGGLTALGVNCANMALPAVACGYVYRRWARGGGRRRSVAAFVCGGGAVLLAGLLTAGALTFSDQGFAAAAGVLLAAHAPVALAEGAVTMFIVSFLARVRPELLGELNAT